VDKRCGCKIGSVCMECLSYEQALDHERNQEEVRRTQGVPSEDDGWSEYL
jgi:hypothetical protein